MVSQIGPIDWYRLEPKWVRTKVGRELPKYVIVGALSNAGSVTQAIALVTLDPDDVGRGPGAEEHVMKRVDILGVL